MSITDNTRNFEDELRDRLEAELRDLLGGLVIRLNRKHFDPVTDMAELKKYDELSDKLTRYLRRIVREGISVRTKDFISHTNALKEINKDLLDRLNRLGHLTQTLKALVDFVGVVEELLNLASPVFGIASPSVGLERATFRSAEKMSHRVDPSIVEYLMEAPHPERDVVDSLPKSKPVAPVPVEEVLHGIELTDGKLIITVATGGCTKKSDFHVEVNTGYTGLPPYLVTVYRIKPDDCKGNFEPIRISFSREELGLDGAVDFRVLNRIGNISQHRLKP